ncbi:MAG: hypothetical protein KKG67_02490 [Gammaproteobacteria bacterium]|nr:hypothetical protein [Gammaproteobacteria bacterium]
MKNIACTLASVLVLTHTASALAQASCSSDGAPQPVVIFERFISADCQACWGDASAPTPSASASVATLDWIVPGKAGDEAPLSAAATNDALARLSALGRKPPTTTDVYVASVDAPMSARLRVAYGQPFNDYLGTGMSLTPARKAPSLAAPAKDLTFHLLLVEAIPAGSDGTAVPRFIVRNMLQGAWSHGDLKASAKGMPPHWMETRSMRIPDGAEVEQLRLVGWVQNMQGQLVAAAQSVCR